MFKFGLKQKIIGGIISMAALFGIILSIQYYQTRKFVKIYQHITDVNLENLRLMTEIGLNYGAVTQDMLELFDLKNPPEKRLALQVELTQKVKNLKEESSDFDMDAAGNEETKLVSEFQKNLEALISYISTFSSVSDRALTDSEISSVSKDKFIELDTHLSASIDKLQEFEKRDTERWESLAKDTEQHSTKMTLFLSLATIFGNLVFAIYFGRSISKSMMKMVTNLATTAAQTNQESTSLSDASKKLSESSTEGAAALQETAAAINQVTAMVKKNTENSTLSTNISKQSRTAAANGKQAVSDVLNAIQEINQSNTQVVTEVEKGNRDIEQIVKVIAEIGQKTKVINDIVFQTKLLSFNASVEAARAGEHGKGFAVVAEEVGNLAQMSGNAAKEISEMLDLSLRNVEGIVANTKERVERMMNEGREKISSGQACANRCGESINEILTAVENVDAKVSEISSASNEQSQGIDEINKAINELDKVTQSNSHLAIDASSSAERLQLQSTKLEEIVHDLQELVLGKAADFKDEPLKKTERTLPLSVAKVEVKSKSKSATKTDATSVVKTHFASSATKPQITKTIPTKTTSPQAKVDAVKIAEPKSVKLASTVKPATTPTLQTKVAAQSPVEKKPGLTRLSTQSTLKAMPIQSTAKVTATPAPQPAVTKKAAGAELLAGTPLHSDPRFEEI